MKVLVNSYCAGSTTYYECTILPPHPQAWQNIKLDLLINRPIVDDPEKLLGKIVEVGWVVAYISIGMDCKIVEQDGSSTQSS